MTLNIPKYFTLNDFRIGGIYFLLRSGVVIYIGITGHLIYRMSEHHPKKFDQIRIIPCAPELMKHYEKRWIIRFRPAYNVQHLFKAVKRRGRITKFIPINQKAIENHLAFHTPQ